MKFIHNKLNTLNEKLEKHTTLKYISQKTSNLAKEFLTEIDPILLSDEIEIDFGQINCSYLKSVKFEFETKYGYIKVEILENSVIQFHNNYYKNEVTAEPTSIAISVHWFNGHLRQLLEAAQWDSEELY